MRSIIAAFSLLAVAGFSRAQIDPSTVPLSLRDTWCFNQKTQCPLICTQQPGVNDLSPESNECDPDTLVYSCVCSNGVTPNVTQYSLTIPYYICTEQANQCVTACGLGNNACSDNCRTQHPCGAQHPNPPNSSISTTMPATSTPTASSTKVPVSGFGGPAATTAAGGKGAASAMLNLGQSYGMAVIFAGVFAGFAIIL
ncbi:uncharacterized protein BDR25DRAFT_57522 [Lindgomyces ingoldianus]|uniref:Uncharacterized protein n=1 Tax=Lindgomyces ingoldianus TaxID=673940 RepID=A0ACB6QM83_9PLEO|nr:uncharacterized protein BDR25DRAFT_57522 [Lindgomyces ingoldianus]KAF2468088.1 hypothetical protein BDR25DRAFT_57522 [Lindgomyces ingoldianus]